MNSSTRLLRFAIKTSRSLRRLPLCEPRDAARPFLLAQSVSLCFPVWIQRLRGAMAIKTIIEPFRIKSVEPIRRTTTEERQRLLAQAGYNLFLIPSESIL